MALAAALTSAICAAGAVAQEPAPPPPPIATAAGAPSDGGGQATNEENAAREAELGYELYRSGQFGKAFDHFERAWQLNGDPKFLYNMSKIKEKEAKYGEAIEFLERYLEGWKQRNGGAPAPNAADVDNQIAELRKRAFRALPEVSLSSSPTGAQVFRAADGTLLGSTPVLIHMKPGRHKLVLKLHDHVDLEVVLAVPESGPVNAVFSMKSKVRRAAISLWCNIRGAQIGVDGKVVAVTPYSGRVDVSPGRHQVTLQKQGYKPVEQIVDVPEDKELQLAITLQRAGSTGSWRTYLAVPLLVGGVGGVASGYWFRGKADQHFTGTYEFEFYEDYQNIGYGAGGAAFGIGAALLAWDLLRSDIPQEDVIGPLSGRPREQLRPLGAPGGEDGR